MKSKINDSPICILVKDQNIFCCPEIPSAVDKGKILRQNEDLASQGYRVIAIASGEIELPK